MNRQPRTLRGLFAVIGLLLSTAPAASWAGQTDIGDFALIDHQHRFHQLSHYREHAAVLVFLMGEDCVSSAHMEQLRALRREHSAQQVAVLMLSANLDEAPAAVRQRAKRCNIEFPVLIDTAQLVARDLGVARSGDTVLLQPAAATLAYRGPLNNGSEVEPSLADALSELLAGDSAETRLVANRQGESIEFAAVFERPVSYHREVVSILKERCSECHREGGIGPWAMTSHTMVQGWSTMMRETVMTKRMPPGQIDDSVGEWVDLHRITPQEQATLVSWIDAGAPKDGDRDPLQDLAPVTAEWALGEPDMIVDFPPETLPPTGVIDYIHKTVDLNLTEDKWVSAIAFNVGDPKALHHVLVYVQDQDATDKSIAGQALIGFYVPGKSEVAFPDGVGFFLGKDKRLLLQLHYTTYGKEAVDATEFGLYFHEQPPQQALRTRVTVNARFKIPPHDSNYELSAATVIEDDAYLHSFAPHMHMRGKNVSYKAVFPDGREEMLIAVPNYQFNWQMNYQLKEPIFLPAGTKIVTDGAFDNSTLNPFNPDPNEEVTWGEQSWEEMFLHFMSVSRPYEGRPEY